jgi:hypothetical protein
MSEREPGAENIEPLATPDDGGAAEEGAREKLAERDAREDQAAEETAEAEPEPAVTPASP